MPYRLFCRAIRYVFCIFADMCATFFHCRASKDKIIKRYMNMIIYNRIAVIAILLLSLLTTSCNTGYTRNHADEIRESITDLSLIHI